MGIEQPVTTRHRSTLADRGARRSVRQRGWVGATAIVAAVALLAACGSDGDTESDGASGTTATAATEPAAPAATEPAAPVETDPAATSDPPATSDEPATSAASTDATDEPASGVGLAVVDVDGVPTSSWSSSVCVTWRARSATP